MAWKNNYSKVRNATWIWYLLALFCFAQAVMSYGDNGNQFGAGFAMWIGATTGLLFSAGRSKRAAAAKVRSSRDVESDIEAYKSRKS